LLADDERLDDGQHLRHRHRLGERPVGGGALVQQVVEGGGVAALDGVDRQRGGQDLLALDPRRLTQIGGGAEILHRRRQRGHLRGAVDRELERRLADRMPERGGHLLQRRHVLRLLGSKGLDRGERGTREQPAGHHLAVEVRLQVLERERVVDDRGVAGGRAGRGHRGRGGARRFGGGGAALGGSSAGGDERGQAGGGGR